VFLVQVSPAAAHRLDEYLQATRVAIDADRVGLEIDLTAGANVASRIFASIDSDRDGRLSDVEQQRYARLVVDSLQLAVDGRTSPLVLVSHEFPTYDEMAAGTGPIRLRAEVRSPLGTGHHEVAYVNTHTPEASVYLVNALVPSDARVHIGLPARDPKQRGLRLDVDVAPDAAWFRVGWTMAALLGVWMFRNRLGFESRTLVAARVRYLRKALRS
jgi:hypothetical protein